MSENVYCAGQKKVTTNYRDGITRIQRGHPDMNKDVKMMLWEYKKKGKFSSILLFFVDKCEFDEEYSAFLLREVMRGHI